MTVPIRNTVIAVVLMALLMPVASSGQQDHVDEPVTIEAYYLLEQFLLDLGDAQDVQSVVDRLSLGNYTYTVIDGERISSWEAAEGKEAAELSSSDPVLFNLSFNLDWLCRELGISAVEMEIAIDELGQNYETLSHYTDFLDGTENYFFLIEVDEVILEGAFSVDLNQTDLATRLYIDSWAILKLGQSPFKGQMENS